MPFVCCVQLQDVFKEALADQTQVGAQNAAMQHRHLNTSTYMLCPVPHPVRCAVNLEAVTLMCVCQQMRLEQRVQTAQRAGRAATLCTMWTLAAVWMLLSRPEVTEVHGTF